MKNLVILPSNVNIYRAKIQELRNELNALDDRAYFNEWDYNDLLMSAVYFVSSLDNAKVVLAKNAVKVMRNDLMILLDDIKNSKEARQNKINVA